MSKVAIIGGGVVLMVCLLLIVGAFMMGSKRTPSMEPPVAAPKMTESPVAESPAVEEKISGYVKLYSGCNYDGEILKSMEVNDIPISNMKNFKSSITSDHYTTVPLAQRDKLVFKSIETKNADLSGTYKTLGMVSQEVGVNMTGNQRMSFCDPNNKENGGATKLNLTFKLIKK